MLKKIATKIYNSTVALIQRGNFKYKYLWPIVSNIRKDYDEEILEKAMRFVAHSRAGGDYLEFGVWKGRSFVKAFYMNKILKDLELKSMRFFAFDSFQGLPKINEGEAREFNQGQYKCSKNDFKRILINNKVDLERTVIVEGWFNEVLNHELKKSLDLKKVAIVYIDCDLYESTVPVLDFITDIVVDGTIIIFDDWFCFGGNPNKGEQRAFNEWKKRNPQIETIEWQKANWKSNSFIVRIQ